MKPNLAWCFALLLAATPVESGILDSLGLHWTHSKVLETTDSYAAYRLPVGPHTDSGMEEMRVEGRLDRTVLHIESNLSANGILAVFRRNLRNAGFDILYECVTRECGGYGFRAGFDLARLPYMYVDLGDFAFLSASRSSDQLSELVTVFASRSSARGFAQFDALAVSGQSGRAGTSESRVPEEETLQPDQAGETSPMSSPLADMLDTHDRVVLEGLVFETGSTELGSGDFLILHELAEYLRSHPHISITLVGHTDASGSRVTNAAISHARAVSVMERLIEFYNVDASKVSAAGIGFLAPRASNVTEHGKSLNRRVEAVITSRESE